MQRTAGGGTWLPVLCHLRQGDNKRRSRRHRMSFNFTLLPLLARRLVMTCFESPGVRKLTPSKWMDGRGWRRWDGVVDGGGCRSRCQLIIAGKFSRCSLCCSIPEDAIDRRNGWCCRIRTNACLNEGGKGIVIIKEPDNNEDPVNHAVKWVEMEIGMSTFVVALLYHARRRKRGESTSVQCCPPVYRVNRSNDEGTTFDQN